MSRLAAEMPGLTQLLSPASVPVVSVNPAIGASPTSLSFTAQQGGGNPTAQTLSISNTGGGTLSWSASPNTTWLAVSPASGTGNGAVTVSATTGILTVGSYNGNINLSATGASSMSVPVTFTVTEVPTISLSPASLTYTATQGAANPTNQTITVSNTGGTLSWTTSDDAAWLSVTPATGSGNGTLTASVNTASLATGTYTGTITVTASGATSRTVGVTLTVNASASSSATLNWNANTESDLAGYKVYRATASGAYGAPIATLPGNSTSYVANLLQVGTTYFFVVTAYDNAGNESLFSNEVSKSIL
jgi:Viral BACON domain